MEAVKTKLTDFQIKSSVFKLTTIHLSSNDLHDISVTLKKRIEKAPQFFNNTPVIIEMNNSSGLDNDVFCKILKLFHKYSIIPIAVNTNDISVQKIAYAHNIGVISYKTMLQETNESFKTRVVNNTVRSGQQIYVPNADLIVMAPVSSGAELLADGHVHIYSTCRGRVLSGINGNINSMIFCNVLDAELISIAGHYIVREDIPKNYLNKSVRISLVDNKLVFQLI